jgi:CRISPR-associated exonuclease Cas4
VQLCAQALCLEEMLGVSIAEGALFYGQRKRRTEVRFDAALRERTEAAARRLHELIDGRITPLACREPKCDRCSLLNLCLPHAIRPRRTASGFFDRQLAAALAADGPGGDL